MKATGIQGVVIKDLEVHIDSRGWLLEVFRIDTVPRLMPAMAYVSCTGKGIVRGPHEHYFQTDAFCFLGSFAVQLWDNRKSSPTYRKTIHFRVTKPKLVVVPPGVAHAYKALKHNQLVLNLPDQLYKEWGRQGVVDEIRYEDRQEKVLQGKGFVRLVPNFSGKTY